MKLPYAVAGVRGHKLSATPGWRKLGWGMEFLSKIIPEVWNKFITLNRYETKFICSNLC